MRRRTRRRQPDPRDLLYAEWRRHDDARTAREDELVAIVGAPAEAIQRHLSEDGVKAAREDDGRPGALKGLLGATCSSCHHTGIPEGSWTSVRTGRTYEPRVTPSGLVFGWEHKSRFISVTAGGHTIERSANGHRRVDLYVDGLAETLRKRAETIEGVKAYCTRPEDHEVLDNLLQRWFRWPCKWLAARKRMRQVVARLRIPQRYRDSAMSTLNTKGFRETWPSKQQQQ